MRLDVAFAAFALTTTVVVGVGLESQSATDALAHKPALRPARIDDEHILSWKSKLTTENVSAWSAQSGAHQFCAAEFELCSKEVGAFSACLLAEQLFQEVPDPLKGSLIHRAALSVFRASNVADLDLVNILRSLSGSASVQIFSAFAEIHGERDARSLQRLWEDAGKTFDPHVEAIVKASITLRTEDLVELPLDKSRRDAATAELVGRLSMLSVASHKALWRSLGSLDPNALAKACFSALITPAKLKEITEALTDSSRNQFITQTIDLEKRNSPLEILDFARVFNANEFTPDSNSKVVAALLRASPSETNRWLVTLGERGSSTMEAALKDLRSSNKMAKTVAENWLTAARVCGTVDASSVKYALSWADYHTMDDYLSAINLVQPNDQDDVRNFALLSYGYNLSLNNSPALTPLLDSSSTLTNEQVNAIAASFANSNPEAAANLLSSTTDARAQSALATALAQATSPFVTRDEQIQMCLQAVTLGGKQSELTSLVSNVIGLFLGSDSQTAIRLLDQLPPSAVRDTATVNFVSSWAAMDSVAASDWVNQLPAGNVRDLSTAAMVRASYDDPEVALASAQSIQDAASRVDAEIGVVDHWKALNPSFITQTINSSQLSSVDKALLLSRLQ